MGDGIACQGQKPLKDLESCDFVVIMLKMRLHVKVWNCKESKSLILWR